MRPGGGWSGWSFAALGAIASLVAQVRVHGVQDEYRAYRAIVPVVHAFVLTVGGLAVAHKPAWALPFGLYYVAFGVTLRRRPMREQI